MLTGCSGQDTLPNLCQAQRRICLHNPAFICWAHQVQSSMHTLLVSPAAVEGMGMRARRGPVDPISGGVLPAVHSPLPRPFARRALTFLKTRGLAWQWPWRWHNGAPRSTVAPRRALMLGRRRGPEPVPEASDMRQVSHSLTLILLSTSPSCPLLCVAHHLTACSADDSQLKRPMTCEVLPLSPRSRF